MRTVAVVLEGSLAVEVTAWAETEAGWHVSTVDGSPAPELVLASAVVPGRTTAVVIDGEATPEQVRTALREGAVDVISWPAERERLVGVVEAAAAMTAATSTARRGPRVLAIAGAGGGAGTSTVALAVGGLFAWAGRSALVLGDDDLLRLAGRRRWQGPGLAEVLELDPVGAAEEVGQLSHPVAGVPGLRLLGPGRPSAGLASVAAGLEPAELADVTRSWPVDVVVVDRRTNLGGADLVLARPDRCLTAVANGPVVVVGRGHLDAGAARRLLGRRPLGWLPDSARVARAGLNGRVPSGIPGTWLDALRPLLGAVVTGGVGT